MLWPDIGPYVGPTANRNAGGMVEHRGVVLHIASGFYDGTIAWQKNKTAEVSSHFIVARDGRCAQMVDTADEAWAERAGNAHWISVELEGFAPEDALHKTHPGWETATAAQIEVCARILARAHAVYAVPLQLAVSPSGKGLGHHSMGAEAGADWGHASCPGTAIKNQKPQILARAQALAGGIVLTGASVTTHSIDDVYNLLSRALGGFTDKGLPTENLLGTWIKGFQDGQSATIAAVNALTAKVGTLSQPAVDTSAVAAQLTPELVAALKTLLDGATLHTAGS